MTAITSEISSDNPRDAISCVTVDGRDADHTLLNQLSASTRKTFVPASECERVMDPRKGSFHRPTGKQAVIIEIRSNHVMTKVKYRSYHHGKWAQEATLEVNKEDGQWKIVRVTNHTMA
jgi:hypothetical protein